MNQLLQVFPGGIYPAGRFVASDRMTPVGVLRLFFRMNVLVFCIAVAYAIGLEALSRPFAIEGMYFHRWSSEDMMQTVSLRHLRQEPLQTLLNIHIQPPAFDAIRAILALPWKRLGDLAALRRVDQSLYLMGALLLGALVAGTYAWLAHVNRVVGLLGALVLMLHPASIFFATYLDSTLLSSVLIFFTFYYLWHIKHDRALSIVASCFLVLGLFFTRSIFQWPFIFLIALSLLCLGVRARRVWSFALVTSLVAGAYLAKQEALFGLLSTSSFAGISLSNSIGVGLTTEEHVAFLDMPGHPTRVTSKLPDVLTTEWKMNGRRNFNHIDYLYLNQQLIDRYLAALRSKPATDLARSYLENTLIYFMPTASYDEGHVIVDRLPWTALYDAAFSAPVLPVLLLLALVIWLLRNRRHGTLRASVGLLLPAIYILAVSMLTDRGENMRFKFWLEPVMLVFIIWQIVNVRQLIGTPRWPRRPSD